MEITELSLMELARSRAQVSYELMIKADPSLKERITLGEVKAVEASKEGIPLDINIRIK
jgi:hypothetical protein